MKSSMLIAEGSHWGMVAMKSTENMIDIECTYISSLRIILRGWGDLWCTGLAQQTKG